jgi:hypothetical protein
VPFKGIGALSIMPLGRCATLKVGPESSSGFILLTTPSEKPLIMIKVINF